MKTVPVLVTNWERVVTYPANHLNDFAFFKGLDQRWHLIGIMGTGTWESETSFFHCSSADIMGDYEIHPPLLEHVDQGATTNPAVQKHAPFVVVADGLHHLYFRRPWGTNLHLASANPLVWPVAPEVVFEERDARDTCIQRFDDRWYWYYVQRNAIEGIERSCVMLRTSADLRTWSEAQPIFVDYSREVRHCKLESPVVIRHLDRYYLFVRDRHREGPGMPAPTCVWASEKPELFDSSAEPIAVFPDMQAPEVVEHEGSFYVARVSGAAHACGHGLSCIPGNIEIARLSFTTIPN